MMRSARTLARQALRLKIRRLVVLAFCCAAAASVATATSAAAGKQVANTPSDIYATARFYSEYEQLSVHFVLGANDSCVQDQYGFYTNPNCDDIDQNNGTFDVRVYQTYPRWRAVHSERDYGISGTGSVELFWTIDLGAPFLRIRTSVFADVQSRDSPLQPRDRQRRRHRFRDVRRALPLMTAAVWQGAAPASSARTKEKQPAAARSSRDVWL